MQFIRKAYRRWQLHTQHALAGLSLCRVCDQWACQPVCANCWDTHAPALPRCASCALPVTSGFCRACQDLAPDWQRCAVALPYSGPWPALIAAFKYQGEVGLAGLFGQQMRQQALVQQVLENVDGLVPVPLSREKLRQRGYNQSQWLAHHICAKRTLPQALLRGRDTPAQAGLTWAQRQHNLDHAITWNPSQAKDLQGKRLALVDDVMTTGSTLAACAQALWQAGAVQVDCLVLARAALGHTPQSGTTP